MHVSFVIASALAGDIARGHGALMEPKRDKIRVPVFSRPQTAASHLTELGCPDCRGVLSVRVDDETGLVSFSCRIGHRFSDASLLPIKEDQLETALWTVVELYEEIALVHRALSERADPHAVDVSALRERVERAEASGTAIRKIIADDRPAIVAAEHDER